MNASGSPESCILRLPRAGEWGWITPEARGRGVGPRLVAECLSFARQAGYRKVTLWTVDVLGAARYVYEKAGFRLVRQEPHTGFGQGLMDEVWELEIDHS